MHTSKTQTVTIIHSVNSTGLKPRSNPASQLFKRSIKINTQFPLTLMQSLRWEANGLWHHCNNGAAHGIMPQALEAFPNINY